MPPQTQLRIQQPLYFGIFTTEADTVLSFVLPGELVETDPLRILEPSPDRILPGCIHFGVCGGCHYQHIRYPAQLALKSQILQDILVPRFLPAIPPILIYSDPEWRYRNRIRLRLEQQPGEEPQAGYSLRGSNDFLPIRMCPIAAPLLWRTAETLLALASRDPTCARLLAAVSAVELFVSGNESHLQLQFFLKNSIPSQAFSSFCERLQAEIPQISGAGAEPDPDLDRRLRRSLPALAWGTPGLNYHAAERSYWVSRGAFFQVNRFLVDRLVDLVVEPVGTETTGSLAWDLFAGVGLFTRALAPHFKRVVAVESGSSASADLRAASKASKDFEAVQSATLAFLEARVLERDRPDLIVLDPPRAGLGPEASALLVRIAAPRLVYVSCDPLTLARDLAILTRTYAIQSLHLIDLFPQTFHMETVVHLSLR